MHLLVLSSYGIILILDLQIICTILIQPGLIILIRDLHKLLLQVKQKEKLEEDKERHTDNWSDHFDNLKATYEKEEESKYIDKVCG